MNYLKKMSIATMSAIPKNYKDMPHGEQKKLVRIIGHAEELESYKSPYGDGVKFLGTFKATDINTGEMFRSKTLFLPDVASDQIEEAITAGQGEPVEFALEIGIRRVVKKNAAGDEMGQGYEYFAAPLFETDSAVDPLAALEARVMKSLSAPVTVEPEREVETPKAGKGK